MPIKHDVQLSPPNPWLDKNKATSKSVLRIEAFGFSSLILLSWLTELIRLPHVLFGEPFAPNWERAALRTVIIMLMWGWVHWMTQQLIKRLHYLEEFLRVCCWCRKVSHRDEWLSMEEYFTSKFATQTSHGMCPECAKSASSQYTATLPGQRDEIPVK